MFTSWHKILKILEGTIIIRRAGRFFLKESQTMISQICITTELISLRPNQQVQYILSACDLSSVVMQV